MNIAVAGTGYVGLSMATLLAQHNHVAAVDVVPEKVDMMQSKIAEILISNYQPQKIKILAEHILDSDFFACKYYCAVLVTTDNDDITSDISKTIKTFMKKKSV